MSSSPTLLAEIFKDSTAPEDVKAFSHAPGTRVLVESGGLGLLGKEAASLGKRAMIVTDPGIVAAGYAQRAQSILEEAGLAVSIFSGVHENPSTADVRLAVGHAQDHNADLLIGLGGGSSMDAAKGCNFILTNGGEMKDYWGHDKATKPMLPMIAIPTTAGTGSECQSYALIADEHTHRKMACGDKKAAAKVAILDPVLTLSQPTMVTAVTAIDALSHAIESHVSKAATDVSRAYALAGFELMREAIVTIHRDPKDLLGRARMQVGAALAGTAIENSMLGAAHSMANPLTANAGIIHGQAVGVALPAVIRRNAAESPAIAQAYQTLMAGDEPLDSWFVQRLQDFDLEISLSGLGLERSIIPRLATEATEQWTAQFNPATLDAAGFERLYEEIWA